MSRETDDRSAIARAYQWSVRVTTIAIEMVLPGVLGIWVDRKLGTRFLFTLLGLALGMWLALRELLGMARAAERSEATASEQAKGRHGDGDSGSVD